MAVPHGYDLYYLWLMQNIGVSISDNIRDISYDTLQRGSFFIAIDLLSAYGKYGTKNKPRSSLRVELRLVG